MRYNIFRKHSSDSSAHIISHAQTKRAAQKFIKQQVRAESENSSCKITITHLDDVTNVKFEGALISWSIGFWFEKEQG